VSAAWSSVGFVHWSYPPDQVERLLPPNLQVDMYGGRAWVGYQFLTVAPAAGSLLDRLPGGFSSRAAFNEMRLRVCVVDENGLPGLHHLSVDVNRPSVVRWQRRTLNLPAFNAETAFTLDPDPTTATMTAGYLCRRSDGTTAGLRLRISSASASTGADTDVDRFLTARWRVLLPDRFWTEGDENRWVVTAHDPWKLHRATIVAVDDDALLAAGLDPPDGRGQALWSPGVSVKISTPRATPKPPPTPDRVTAQL
jgi:uncharacterized protein YqjF (DUF2071 family)